MKIEQLFLYIFEKGGQEYVFLEREKVFCSKVEMSTTKNWEFGFEFYVQLGFIIYPMNRTFDT